MSRTRRRHKTYEGRPKPREPSYVVCKATGKRGYSRRKKALHAAVIASRGMDQARIYKCEFCHDFHLTSQSKRDPE